ncbi:MAG TPA: ABC transporter permease [Thermoleophilaceae bacterium]|nr:ABC transporter permease [Thermoleophilaceae bacterium]
MSAEQVELGAFGRPIRGPSALGGDWRRFLHLAWTLAVTDFKLRFFGSVLGYLWQLLRPLMLFGVLLLVFTVFLPLGNDVPHYDVCLLAGIVVFSFFADATIGSVGSLVDRESLVRKIHFPRMVVPVAVVLTAYFNFLLNLIVVLVFALASGVAPRASWLELVPLMLMLGVFALGLAMLLSSLYVRFRDVRPIWEVVAQALFYATPVIYVIDVVEEQHEAWARLLMWNPLSAIVTQVRHAVVSPDIQSASYAIGGTARLLIPIGIVLLTFVLGFWSFNRAAPRIAEQL